MRIDELRENDGAPCTIRICTGRPKGPPGSAGVPPASLCLIPLAGAELSSGAEGSRPVGGNLNGHAEGDQGRSSGSIRVAERTKAVPDMVRAGRPRSRVGILHLICWPYGKMVLKGSWPRSFFPLAPEPPFPKGEGLFLAEQEGAVPAALPGPAAVVDHSVGDKRVVARCLPHLYVPLADVA